MPTYDYRCSGGHRYEKREPFGSPAEQPCDRCGKPAKRVIHAPPIVFKGSGWYQTDSRRGSAGTSRRSDSDSSEASEKRRESQAATAERNAERKAKSSSKGGSSSSSSGGSDGHVTSNGSKPD